jgi:hypothetical protein
MRTFLARRQDKPPVFHIGVEKISWPDIEPLAKWAGKTTCP